MTLSYDAAANELVSVSGTQEFRLQLKAHERDALIRIAETLKDEAE